MCRVCGCGTSYDGIPGTQPVRETKKTDTPTVQINRSKRPKASKVGAARIKRDANRGGWRKGK